MKHLLFAALVVMAVVPAKAQAVKVRAYTDVVVSSYVVKNLSVSSTTATLAVPAPTSLSTDSAWFQADIYNMTSSTIAFSVGPSATSAPADLLCTNKAVIGAGTAANPLKFTQRLAKGLHLWLKDCNLTESSVTVGLVLQAN